MNSELAISPLLETGPGVDITAEDGTVKELSKDNADVL